MTFKAERRFRQRAVAPPPLGRVTVGRYRKISVPTGTVLSDVPVKVDCPTSAQQVERVWDQVNDGPPYRSGGSFTAIKATLPQFDIQGVGSHMIGPPQFGVPNQRWEYNGGFTNPNFNGDSILLSLYESRSGVIPTDVNVVPNANVYCSEVYNKLRPRIERAQLGVALAEARDVPRMLKTTSKAFHEAWKEYGGKSLRHNPIMTPKGVADQFLNVQFGWVPFLKDLSDLHDTSLNAFQYMDKLRKSNGTWQKRSRTINSSEKTTPISSSGTPMVEPWGFDYEVFCTPHNVNGFNSYGHSTLKEVIETNVWGEGSFKFYVPEFDVSTPEGDLTAWNDMKRLMMLYGIRLNPSVVYKATPWTWLADWFTNLGDVVDNLSAAATDQVVSRYMYLMHHQIRKVVRSSVIYWTSGDQALEWSRIIETKQRVAADNPYNLCLSWSALTPKQLTILAAVGITQRGGRG